MLAYYQRFRELYIPFMEQCAAIGLTHAEVLILFGAIDAEMQTPIPHFLRFVAMLLDEFRYPGAAPLLAGQ